jgi:hypothetical protein
MPPCTNTYTVKGVQKRVEVENLSKAEVPAKVVVLLGA